MPKCGGLGLGKVLVDIGSHEIGPGNVMIIVDCFDPGFHHGVATSLVEKGDVLL